MSQKDGDWQCNQCSKKYTNNSSYQAHIKSKHKDAMINPQIYKLKFTEQQLNDLEDRIYVFLGQLGDNNQDTQQRQEVHSSQEEENIANGNYAANYAVRNPYEDEITLSLQILGTIGRQQWEGTLKAMKEQIMFLQGLLAIEKQKWQFMDPLDADQDPEGEFSLMDISKLIKNINKRQIKLHFSELTIYILWLTRICKIQAWKQIFQSTAYCICQYYDYLKQKGISKTMMSWVNYVATRKPELIQNYKYKNTQLLISNANMDKILKLYYKWVQYFSMLPKKQPSPSNN